MEKWELVNQNGLANINNWSICIINVLGDSRVSTISQEGFTNSLKLMGDFSGYYSGIIHVSKPGCFYIFLDQEIEFEPFTYYEVKIIDEYGVSDFNILI